MFYDNHTPQQISGGQTNIPLSHTKPCASNLLQRKTDTTNQCRQLIQAVSRLRRTHQAHLNTGLQEFHMYTKMNHAFVAELRRALNQLNLQTSFLLLGINLIQVDKILCCTLVDEKAH